MAERRYPQSMLDLMGQTFNQSAEQANQRILAGQQAGAQAERQRMGDEAAMARQQYESGATTERQMAVEAQKEAHARETRKRAGEAFGRGLQHVGRGGKLEELDPETLGGLDPAGVQGLANLIRENIKGEAKAEDRSALINHWANEATEAESVGDATRAKRAKMAVAHLQGGGGPNDLLKVFGAQERTEAIIEARQKIQESLIKGQAARDAFNAKAREALTFIQEKGKNLRAGSHDVASVLAAKVGALNKEYGNLMMRLAESRAVLESQRKQGQPTDIIEAEIAGLEQVLKQYDPVMQQVEEARRDLMGTPTQAAPAKTPKKSAPAPDPNVKRFRWDPIRKQRIPLEGG